MKRTWSYDKIEHTESSYTPDADETDNIPEIDDATFASTLMSNVKLAVEFWKPMCLPCTMMKPVFRKASEQYSSVIRCRRAVATNSTTVMKLFSIDYVPTILMFYHGRVVDTMIGVVSQETLFQSFRHLADL
ncbi:thioredoxin domain-containing protein [Oxyplasma meridianum]|uniref:Thioredoxin domain-containing protein n=1 Tax=Oxyplasma meridianum TaxID=3073602 RepID=A0AAX4NH99_9ARCH